MAFSARNSIFASCILLVLFTDFSLGQSESSLSELLIPVDPNEIYEVLDKNWFAIERHKYNSLRHRFVTINTSVLYNDERFTFTPFPDVPHILVRRESRYVSPQRFTWRGEIEFPVKDQEQVDSYEKMDLTNYDLPMSQSDLVKLMRHKLVGVDFTIRTKTRSLRQPSEDPTPDVGVEPLESGATTNSIRRGNVENVEVLIGTLYSDYHDALYKLTALPDNPEYHIVYEIDREKTKVLGPGGREAGNERRKFLEQLKQERARRKEMGIE